MVTPPRISPTIPKRRPEGPKIKRIHPPYKAQPPQEPAPTPPSSSPARILFTVLGVVALVSLVLGGLVGFGIVLMQQEDRPIDTFSDDPADVSYAYWKQATDKSRQPDTNPQPYDQPTTPPQPKTGSSGYCSSDADCAGFGQRNGGPAVCGSDRLCHICYSLRGETCISCSTGCDVNTYCEKGVCVFRTGGRTTD